MATRHVDRNNGGATPTITEYSGSESGDQREVEAKSEATTELDDDCCSEDGSVSVLWAGQSCEEELSALAQNVQHLWEAGASLCDLQGGAEPDSESESFNCEGRNSCEDEEDTDRYIPWSQRVLSMALSGVPVIPTDERLRMYAERLRREEASKRESGTGALYAQAQDPRTLGSRRGGGGTRGRGRGSRHARALTRTKMHLRERQIAAPTRFITAHCEVGGETGGDGGRTDCRRANSEDE